VVAQAWCVSSSNEECHLVSHALRSIFEDCDLGDIEGIRKWISENAKVYLDSKHKAHVNQGFVLLGGIHGLVMALLPDVHPQHILSDVIVLGYDTDTVAAICGTVLGARFGAGWIPLDQLLEQDRLLAYARAVAVVGRSQDKIRPGELETLEELIKREIDLTAWAKSMKYKNTR